MIYNRPPLNCQKCQFRFFTDQGLERHLLGSHGLVTSSMQEAANKSKDAGRCPVCGRVSESNTITTLFRKFFRILLFTKCDSFNSSVQICRCISGSY